MTRAQLRLAVVVGGLAVAAIVLGLSRPARMAPQAQAGTVSQLTRVRADARAQRLRADYLQALLTRRVLEARALRAELAHRPSTLEALRLAAISSTASRAEADAMYRTLYQLAACESTGTTGRRLPWPPSPSVLKAGAQNPTGERASGLLQFLPSTYAGTPYAHVSIWSPYSQALAAVWMIKGNRLGEWACSWAVRP